MGRPTFLHIDATALQHNVSRIKTYAPDQRILAMVKADAYGCGMHMVLPVLGPLVDGFGVACIEEAQTAKALCPDKECILLHGLFTAEDMSDVIAMQLSVVVHNSQQLTWLTTRATDVSIKVWVKVDTGMHRLGFSPQELGQVLHTLRACTWIDPQIGLMTHLGCADLPDSVPCQAQLHIWEEIAQQYPDMPQSVANSAALVALPQTRADVIRPGLLLYGASPFSERLGTDLDLRPVMHFMSSITTIHHYLPGDAIGYGATWVCKRPSVIGVIPVGYGDGYPRHIKTNTRVWINGQTAPIVGRISMDMMTVDLTDCPNVHIGDQVELWGKHIPIEVVARQAHTVAYELMTQVTRRVSKQSR